MDVLVSVFSLASRPKTHYREKPLSREANPKARTQTGDPPHIEALFLLNLLAYRILQLGRVLMESAQRRE